MIWASSSEEFRQLPNLPSEFGNQWLSNAHEILLPEQLSWFPHTAAWVWLGILALMLSLCLLWLWWQSYQSRRYQRQALQQLQQWADVDQIAAPEVLVLYPELLKQVAYCVWCREDLVSMSAEDWHCFWRNSSSMEPPPLLASLAYQSRDTLAGLDAQACQNLWAWCRRWVERHRQFRHHTVAQLLDRGLASKVSSQGAD